MKLYRVHATKRVWMQSDIKANNEQEAMKLADDKHIDFEWEENGSDHQWAYDYAELCDETDEEE